MKKSVFCAVCLALGAGAVFGAPSWAEVTTVGAKGESNAYADRYTVYLCTADAAATYFGGNSTSAGVTDWLSASADNYASGMAALAGGGIALDAYGFDQGEYSFTKYFQDGLSGGYLAVAAYAGDAETLFRAFDGTADGEGALTLDPDFGAGSAGDWTAAPGSVPEPTSGLLLLLGAAGLALRRRRA